MLTYEDFVKRVERQVATAQESYQEALEKLNSLWQDNALPSQIELESFTKAHEALQVLRRALELVKSPAIAGAAVPLQAASELFWNLRQEAFRKNSLMAYYHYNELATHAQIIY